MRVTTVGPLGVLWSGGTLDPREKRRQRLLKQRQVWEDRLTAVKDAPLTMRYAAVTAVLMEMSEALPASAAGNDPNPAHQSGLSGDGHILANMLYYGGAGFVISIILKYMGRGDMGMLVIAVTGFVVLRQFIFLLKETIGDIKTLVSF